MAMREALRRIFEGRPWWMNAMMLFCAYMAVLYFPYDFFWKPADQDVEVWLGFVLRDWAAKVTEPVHLAIYAAGAWGFFRMRRWMWPWAAVYAAQVGISMGVWTWLHGPGPWAGLGVGAVFSVPAVALWRARPLFATEARARAA